MQAGDRYRPKSSETSFNCSRDFGWSEGARGWLAVQIPNGLNRQADARCRCLLNQSVARLPGSAPRLNQSINLKGI